MAGAIPGMIGFIGVGSMGAPMARRLLQNGHKLIVCDVNSRAVKELAALGARTARSPKEVAARAATIMLCLPSLDAIREVVCGERGVLQGGALRVCVNLSTTGSVFIAEMAAQCRKHEVALLDCPITGGASGAAAGTLSISVSGPKTHFLQMRPTLALLAKHVFYVGGRAGQAQTMKLINNLLSFIAFAGTCEAFVMGAKAGLDPDLMVEVINTGTGRNSATEFKMPRNVLPRTFDYGAKMAIGWKDLSLCLKEAEALGVTMWVANAVRQLFGFAIAHGGATQDVTTLIKWVEGWAGVEVRGKAAAQGSRVKRK